MSPEENELESERLFKLAEKALHEAYAQLVREKRKTNDPLVLWRGGKVCHVPASEIQLPDEIKPIQ